MRRRPGRGRRRRVLRRADPSSSPRRISTPQREGGPLTPQLATLGVATAVVALLAFRSGGYFPSDWGLELGFFALLALVLALAAERLELGRRDLALVAGLGLLAAWSLASAAWSTGSDGPVLAAERTLVYAAAALALALGLSAARVPWLLAGIGVALLVACGYGLATRLLVGQLGDAEDAVTGTRLAEPIGYANALGALAAMAIVLALGFARHRRREVRAVAGASLVPLASVLYLTLSRGSLLALAVALLVLGAAGGVGETAGSLLVLSLPPAAGVLLTVRSPLLDGGLTIERAQSAGHRLGGELVLLALAGGAAGLVARPLARRLAGAAWLAIAVALAAGAAAVVVAGPADLAHRVAADFRAPPPATEAAPTRRLLSTSSSSRSEYWRVAWAMVEREPLLGEGGGSFERWWLQERPVGNDARNAHNLYLETLAELGAVGLVVLLATLAVPLLAPRRRDPLAAAALAAYAAWLVHAFLDWDWQVPGVTLPALACAGALVVLARDAAGASVLGRAARIATAASAAALLVVALAIHAGNRAAEASETALAAGDTRRAAAQARRAREWMPWAAAPWRLLGEAQLARGEDAAARRSLRRALEREPASWQAWFDLAAVTRGATRARALARARELNPLAPELADEG